MKKLFAAFACLSMLATGVASASAADVQFPKNEPINYLIPFSAGGESDLFARLQQPYLEKELGQKVVVNYKIGAGGALGWSELVKSKPDGHSTAGINLPHIVLQPLQRKNAGYQTEDLKPVMIFHVTPCVLAVRADSPRPRRLPPSEALCANALLAPSKGFKGPFGAFTFEVSLTEPHAAPF